MANTKMPGGNELLNPQSILHDELQVTYGSQIGDLGCGGVGYFTFQSAQLVGDTGLVYAVDVQKMILKNIEHRAKMLGLQNIKVVWSNLESFGATKINDGSLDFVLLVNILFQNKHPEKVLREAVRMLRNQGKLLVIDWKQGRFPLGPSADRKIAPEKVSDLALGAGLKKRKEFEAGKFHYGIIFEKI